MEYKCPKCGKYTEKNDMPSEINITFPCEHCGEFMSVKTPRVKEVICPTCKRKIRLERDYFPRKFGVRCKECGTDMLLSGDAL